MATLASLTTTIEEIIRNDATTDLTARINNAVSAICGGILLPDGRFSPPLPDLYALTTVATTANAYASLPTNYQRNLFYVADDNGNRILPPAGGDYYDFILFVNNVTEKDLTESGSVYRVAVKGSNLYYQGIPSASEDLTIMYYTKPTDMSSPADTPSGIPEHFQERLIKHYVCRDVLGDILEGADSSKYKYHTERFYAAMYELVDFIGIDGEPAYMAGGDYVDLGICD